jgi:hypothetical protein
MIARKTTGKTSSMPSPPAAPIEACAVPGGRRISVVRRVHALDNSSTNNRMASIDSSKL